MAMNPASKYDTANIKNFDNEVLTNKFERNLISALDVNPYITVNNELAQNPGMTLRIRTYKGSGSAEDVEMGDGNSAYIGSDFTETDYEVKVVQATVKYYDEQAMNDPNAIDVALQHLSDSFTNDLTAKVVDELGKATIVKDDFDYSFEGVVDALAMFPNDEAISANEKFLLMNKADAAKLIKNAKATLQYVTDYARTGYLGTIAGVNIIQSAACSAGEMYLATKEAITCFVKKGVRLTPEYDAETRENKMVGNVVRVVALTDATKAIKITATV